MTALMQDWSQSQQIIRHPDQYQEENPLLGKTPSQSKMLGAGLVGAVGQYAGFNALPDKWKAPFAAASLIPEAYVVKRNHDAGLPYNKPALGLGALLTAALSYYREKEKSNDSSISVGKIPGSDTLGVIFNKRF